ncbi:tRNA (5-methylaminomethyl-2-thiouridylate)-methyltransferase [Flavobacterium aquatile]|uniref:tRNA (5-methylaminomethyl-2-thiouridylate)-methyltransferase n=1 Tax=Flavobacterium aquatile LMG 4008 = ATCC 11947 TaxID=1453498 RepID=A0A095UWJ7_9FLAO|nr:tRNA (5-methylaminomethyl-2-thiouridylate)-methyltransferase [Flavobacterium aquatile]KGD66950.1 tRNA (5-methylaminomethyl-2-thiouridylate)-methyltransferase [Flavobacterium aquatile LMG 4008 = ATCC 11947]OXA68043.1 hypothetical protein B0A61_06135 [Flavobacterium aquatile LMG 4008 = ATCC 11947]GEC80073.1 hypothetical protein FAQ01_29430 [Flavobacterium aquatile]
METKNAQSIRQTSDLLRYTYGIVPIVAGLDKFFNFLTHWENYIPSSLSELLSMSPHALMIIVGIIEIVAGLIVLVRPIIGGYIVSAWLVLIGILLLIGGTFLDIAVRDFVMAIGAFSLTRLAKFTHKY